MLTWIKRAARQLTAGAIVPVLLSATASAGLMLASAQAPPLQPNSDQRSGTAFGCQDGSTLVLDFEDDETGLSAVVSVHGATYRLPVRPRTPGPVEIVWSDGGHSLTWSTGVRLMWMAEATHLMCGRSHKH